MTHRKLGPTCYLGLVTQLLVSVCLQTLGLAVVRVGEDQVVQQLHRPPVVPGLDSGLGPR